MDLIHFSFILQFFYGLCLTTTKLEEHDLFAQFVGYVIVLSIIRFNLDCDEIEYFVLSLYQVRL